MIELNGFFFRNDRKIVRFARICLLRKSDTFRCSVLAKTCNDDVDSFLSEKWKNVKLQLQIGRLQLTVTFRINFDFSSDLTKCGKTNLKWQDL